MNVPNEIDIDLTDITDTIPYDLEHIVKEINEELASTTPYGLEQLAKEVCEELVSRDTI